MWRNPMPSRREKEALGYARDKSEGVCRSGEGGENPPSNRLETPGLGYV